LNGAEYGTLQLAATDKLLLVYHKGFKKCFLDAFRVVARDDGSACGRTLSSGKTVLLEDIEKDSEFAPFLPVAREAGFRSVISAPLLAHGSELVGVVSTHFANVHRPTDIEIGVFEQFGSLAADHLDKLLGRETLASVAVAMNNRLYDSLAAASHRVDFPSLTLRGRPWGALLRQRGESRSPAHQSLKLRSVPRHGGATDRRMDQG